MLWISGVTSVSAPASTFSSTYTNYYLQVNAETAGGNEPFLRLRAAGVDASGSNYLYHIIKSTGANSPSGETGTTTFAPIAPSVVTSPNIMQVEIFSPFDAVPTRMYSRFFTNTGPRTGVVGINHSLSTSYDAFTIGCASNISGTFAIYGFNK